MSERTNDRTCELARPAGETRGFSQTGPSASGEPASATPDRAPIERGWGSRMRPRRTAFGFSRSRRAADGGTHWTFPRLSPPTPSRVTICTSCHDPCCVHVMEFVPESSAQSDLKLTAPSPATKRRSAPVTVRRWYDAAP